VTSLAVHPLVHAIFSHNQNYQESKKAKKNSKTKERKKKRKWRRRGNPHLQYQSREYFTRDD
jgi:hypothetical protein